MSTQKLLTDGAIGINLKRIRKSRGWSQAYLAAQMQLQGSNISRETLAKIENGRNIKVDDLITAKIVLRTTLDELFDGIESNINNLF